MLLARAGLRVLVVDRSRYGADTLSTHALMRGGVLQLHRWGLLDRVVDAGTPAVRRTTFRYADEEVDHPDQARRRRRRALRAAAHRARPDARRRRRRGRRRRPLRRHRHRPAPRPPGTGHRHRGPRRRRAAGRRRRGRSSSAPTACARRSPASSAHRSSAPAPAPPPSSTATGPGSTTDGYEWIFRPGRLRRRHPDQRRPDLRLRRAPRRPASAAAARPSSTTCSADASPARRRPGAPPAPPPAGVRTFTGRPGLLRRAWGPGWALVGDAGYWKDPLSAHGLTDALRDAELLARAIISAATADEPEPVALADYQSTRDRLSRPMFDAIDVIAGQQWSDDEIGPLLRRTARRWRTRSGDSPRSTSSRRASASPAAQPAAQGCRPGSGPARAGTRATPGRARAAGGCSSPAGPAGSPG